MKNVTYFKRELPGNKGRVVSVREFLQDKQAENRIAKNYVYLVSRADELPKEAPAPSIHMFKRIRTEAQEEFFRFRVKGTIYMKKKRFIFRVDYCHSLTIRLTWKTHVLSPKKPAALA